MVYFLVAVIVVFSIASILLALLSRHRKLHPSTTLIGATGIVDKPLDPQGAVIIEGEVWLARSEDGEHFPKDAAVRVAGLKDQVLLVKTIIGH